jgi:hypothetical protein
MKISPNKRLRLRFRPGVTLKKTKKPHRQALSLSNIVIGDKIVTRRLIDGIPQIVDAIDSMMDAITVISTSYEDGTVVYHGFDLKPVTAQLADLGIPILHKSDSWSDKVCTFKLDYVLKLIKQHLEANRVALNQGYMVERPTATVRQLVSMTGHALTPSWEKK